ncbi:uncharacterized protein LOC144432036 [Styela clava]
MLSYISDMAVQVPKIRKNVKVKQIAGICGVFVALFLLSAIITSAILYLLKKPTMDIRTRRVVGSVRIEEIRGKSLEWTEDMRNISSSPLKKTMEKVVYRCLYSFKPQSVVITKMEQDEFARILKVNNRGIVVHWSALLDDDTDSSDSAVAMAVMDCEEDILLEPESVSVGLESMQESRMFESLETFLLDTDEEFDLRNIEFSTATHPKFTKGNVSCPPLEVWYNVNVYHSIFPTCH